MKSILIVEDDDLLADAYQLELKGIRKFKVDVVNNGLEALEFVKTTPPDLIILDLLTPREDGLNFLEALRADTTFSFIPVVVASNVDDKEQIQKVKDLGVEEYFIKSNISVSDLIKKCRQYL